MSLYAVRVAAPEGKYSLPSHVGLGVQTIHHYWDSRWASPSIVTTGFVPLPTDEFPGIVLNLNAKTHQQTIRNRCIIGDASLKMPFFGIDKRPGTPLDRWLNKIVEDIPQNADGKYDVDTVVQYLIARKHERLTASQAGAFAETPKTGYKYAGLPEHPRLNEMLASAWNHVVYTPAIDTGEKHPVVPFEEAWESGTHRLCIATSLLALLVLERCEIPARLVNGANIHFPNPSAGHSWIELEDGRWLDLPMGIGIGTPQGGNPDFPTWKRFGSLWRYETNEFPHLAWFDANER